MRPRRLFLTLLLLAGSCGREQHDVSTGIIGGKVRFLATGTVGIFPHKPCLKNLSVKDEKQQLIWSVRRSEGVSCALSPGFPLTFGEAPAGFQSGGLNGDLRRSVVYVIDGDDQRTSAAYVGGFRLISDGSRIINYKWFDGEIQRIWQAWSADRV